MRRPNGMTDYANQAYPNAYAALSVGAEGNEVEAGYHPLYDKVRAQRRE